MTVTAKAALGAQRRHHDRGMRPVSSARSSARASRPAAATTRAVKLLATGTLGIAVSNSLSADSDSHSAWASGWALSHSVNCASSWAVNLRRQPISRHRLKSGSFLILLPQSLCSSKTVNCRKLRSPGFGPAARAQVRLELELECLTTTVDKRFGGRYRAAEHLGNLLVAHFVTAAQHDRRALVFGKFSQSFLDFFFQLPLQKAIGRGKGFLVLILLQRPILVLGMGRIEGIGPMTGTPANFVQAEIPRAGKEPRGKLSGNLVSVGGFKDLQENHLGQIFGLGCVPDHPV